MSDIADALERISALERTVADLREHIRALRAPVVVEFDSRSFADDSPRARALKAHALIKAAE
jgi:hypothetical protein